MKKGASPSICCHIWCHIPICADNLVFLRLSVNMEFQEVTSLLFVYSLTGYHKLWAGHSLHLLVYLELSFHLENGSIFDTFSGLMKRPLTSHIKTM